MKRNKIIKIGAGITAVLISGIIIVNMMYQTSVVTYARESLPGVETIVANNGSSNPYIILEVVPEKKEAQLGYLIGGEEPLANGKSYQEMPVKAERQQANRDALLSVSANSVSENGISRPDLFGDSEDKPLTITEYQEPGDGSRSFSLRGHFLPDENGEYVAHFTDADYQLITDGNYDGVSQKYTKYTEYPTLMEDGGVPTVTKITDTDVEREMEIEGTTYKTAYKYLLDVAWSGKNLPFTLPDLSAAEGQQVFVEGTDQYHYLGTVERLGETTLRAGNELLPSLSDNSVSDNTVTDDTVSGNEAEDTDNKTDGTDNKTEDTDNKTEDTDNKTEDTGKKPEDTVSENTYREYAMLVEPLLTEVFAIHTYDGNYLVFEDSFVGECNGITTIKVEEDKKETYVIGTLEENSYAGDYYISKIEKPSGTPHSTPFLGYKQFVWFNPDENGNYYLAADASTAYEVYDSSIHTGTDVERLRWVSDYSDTTMEEVKYQGGITNKEWFKKFVFDREKQEEYDNLVIDVKTVTMEELNTYDLGKVDLVYFAGGTNPYPADIQQMQAIDVFTRVMKEKMPVMMNRSVAEYNKDRNPNLYKLSILLRQQKLDNIDMSEDENGKNSLERNWNDNLFWQKQENTIKTPHNTYGLFYCNRSVLVFDDVMVKDGKISQFVNSDFNKVLSAEQIAYGFSEVEAEITNENLYRQLAGKDKLSTDMTQASAIRYIINYASQRNVIKSKIQVLELQPCATEGYTEAQLKRINVRNAEVSVNTLTRENIDTRYIAENWATQFIDKPDAITLDSTYTGEFIGQIKDLNESYDLIFIGMDTTTMNTVVNRGVKTNQTVYNRSEMNGLVYTHTGDELLLANNEYYIGLLDPNNIANEKYMDEYHRYRFSGNDITPDKLRELKEFIDAGFPIIFEDGFFTKSGEAYRVNKEKIDTTSHLYALGEYVISKDYMNKRAFVDSEVSQSGQQGIKKDLKDCLNRSKLIVDLTRRPTQYQEGVADSYLKGDNGTYLLEYEFYLKNDAALSLLETKYNCKLYIDTNVDGRFSDAEEIEGLQILELQNQTWKPISQTEGKFQLTAGHYYRMQRTVPSGYAGILPWKLVFEQVDNDLVRKSINGYSAVPVPINERQVIKVLQLTSGDGTGTNLDLTSSTIRQLLSQVQDFDIQVSKRPVGDYIKTQRTVSNPNNFTEYSKELNKYDMLVLGFIDMYRFESGSNEQKKAAALAIRQYINDGRSVLFTHDTTSYRNTDTEWGYFFNRYIRDMVGMDRYGVMTQIAQKEGFTPVDSVFDQPWKPSKTGNWDLLKNKQGYSDGTVIAGRNLGDTTNNPYIYTARRAPAAAPTGQYGGKMYVTEVNNGQITEYPFKIPANFEVSTTHNQYYQLNLETNSRDDKLNDDIVVWYCISDVDGAGNDDFYQATPNNVRNNYYIYNKGNVTYSGVGHDKVDQTIEMKLFVNTMVAAYNAGIHPPRIVYKEDGKEEAAPIEYCYLPFDDALKKADGTLGGFIEEECELFFDVSDTSFVQGTKTITANYYIEAAPGTAGAVKKTVEGKELWLLEVKDSEIMSMTNVGTGAVLTGEGMHKVDNNTRYRMVLPTSLLQLVTKNNVNFYTGVKTEYLRNGELTVTDEGFYKLGMVRTQLFDLK